MRVDPPEAVHTTYATEVWPGGCQPSATPSDPNVKLVKEDGVSKKVDQLIYQSIVGSLLYAAVATRPLQDMATLPTVLETPLV